MRVRVLSVAPSTGPGVQEVLLRRRVAVTVIPGARDAMRNETELALVSSSLGF